MGVQYVQELNLCCCKSLRAWRCLLPQHDTTCPDTETLGKRNLDLIFGCKGILSSRGYPAVTPEVLLCEVTDQGLQCHPGAYLNHRLLGPVRTY